MDYGLIFCICPGANPGSRVLFGMNCFNRTNICTCTTVCAYIGIDNVDVTF